MPLDSYGNFNLAIFDPSDIPRHNVSEFCEGRIPPSFVIEMGLNYGSDHLVADDTKLANSGCGHGYLVHLWQPHKGIRPANLDSLKDWCRGRDHVAAAVFVNEDVFDKHLKDPELISS